MSAGSCPRFVTDASIRPARPFGLFCDRRSSPAPSVPIRTSKVGPETANRRRRRDAKLRTLPLEGARVAELPKDRASTRSPAYRGPEAWRQG